MTINRVQKRPKIINSQSVVRTVEFDPSKITSAVYRAGVAVGQKDYNLAVEITKKVVAQLERIYPDRDIVQVEEIQDVVEWAIIQERLDKIAKSYILYRKQHEDLRKAENIVSSEKIDEYLGRSDLAVKENANMTFSLQGLNTHISEAIIQNYWLDKAYPEHIKNSFISGDMHIHDLGSLAVYCVGWDLEDLLTQGITGVPGKPSSKPAKHFRAALGQAVNFLYTMQGEAAGAQAFSNFDTLLAPFIRYDNLDYKQVKQSLQEFIFNMNVPTRVGFQTPFTNVTLDLKVPEFLKNQPVIIGGKYMDTNYGDCQVEMDMINRAFAEVMLEGDAEGRVFTFPIPTYNITEDFDWDNPVYEPIWEMTAKYGIPNWSNFIGSDMNPEDARSMCCRLRLDNRELQKRMGGLFAAAPLTGSIGVVTINMPRLGYVAEDEEDFYSRLGMLMDIAKDSLEIKRKVLENYTEVGLYPYTKYYLKEVKSASDQYWINHFSTIGLVGMNECCLNFLKRSIADPEGHIFTEQVMDFMLKRIECYQQKTGNLYNLESTPAEGASHKLALKDKERYPLIVASGQEKAWYYTNSTQLPVGCTDDLFSALKLQESLQTRYTGGTTFHCFLGEKVPNIEAVKKLVSRICQNYKLPYFTITPTFSVCKEHGYLPGEYFTCPICDAVGVKTECEVYSRVVGYIRPVQQWNAGQREQYSQRANYDSAVGRTPVLQLS